MIEQPTRRTVGRPLRFHALCPACWQLLVLEDGRWPKHPWSKEFEGQCLQSDQLHETLRTLPPAG